VQFQKISTLTPWTDTENSEGGGAWGVSKSKKYYRKVWSETGTSRGVGENLENWRGGYFVEPHNGRFTC